MPLSDQLKQLAELHKVAEQAMKGFIVIKWSVCIEGARRAFARVKVQWARLDAVKLMKEGPPEG